MAEDIELRLNSPIILSHGSKEGTGNVAFMGGSFYVTNLDPTHLEGKYVGATLGCNMFQGNPSPRRVVALDSPKGDGPKS